MIKDNPIRFPSPALVGLLLGTALCLGGCGFPTAPEIKVTIKAAETDADAETDEGTEETTVEGYGHFVGRVTFEGTPPELAALVNKGDAAVKDPSICAAETIPNESLEVDPQTKGIANVVIYLKKSPKQINPDIPTSGLKPAMFDQKGCKFFPHVLPVRVDAGQPLLVLSGDSIAHNTHTYASRNTNFNGSIEPNDRKGVSINYTRPEAEPIEVTCDFHNWMKAYHFPIDHPYFAVTKPDGSFRIEGLPAGKHVFKVWQERGKLLERNLEVTIQPDAETSKDLAYKQDKFN